MKTKERSLAQRKEDAEAVLDRIRADEESEMAEKVRDGNLERFMDRFDDWIIGKAHAQFKVKDNGWHHPKGERLDSTVLPSTVNINGNCGSYYIAAAQVTSATNTYFHNVIPGVHQHWFTKKMIEITKELMDKVLGDPKCVLELMGLQSTTHYKMEKYFNEDDIPKIDSEIQKAQDEVLSRFPVEQLKRLGRLSHGGGILSGHLKRREKRS